VPTVADGGVGAPRAAPALRHGLVAYYPFSAHADDESDNGHDGAVVAAESVTGQDGVPGTAYRFTATDDRIDISSVPNLQALTICAWFRMEAPAAGALVGFDGRYALLVSGDGMLRGDCKAGSSGGGRWTGGPTATNSMCDGEWHHVAWSRSSTGYQELYLDGALAVSGQYSSGATPDVNYGGFIGCYRRSDGVYGGRYQGDLDDVCIYGRPLSPNEVSELAGAEVAADSDGDGMPDVWEARYRGRHMATVADTVGDS